MYLHEDLKWIRLIFAFERCVVSVIKKMLFLCEELYVAVEAGVDMFPFRPFLRGCADVAASRIVAWVGATITYARHGNALHRRTISTPDLCPRQRRRRGGQGSQKPNGYK